MPGYRDRIVHVGLGADEGGLNLSMPDEMIAAVGARREKAGELLAGRFAPTPTAKDRLTDPQSGDQVQLTWDNQRWIRYRSLMAALEVVVQRLRRSWVDSEKPEATAYWRSYAELLARGAKDLPSSYRLRNVSQHKFATEATRDPGSRREMGKGRNIRSWRQHVGWPLTEAEASLARHAAGQ